MRQIREKVALVTGAASGIGRAIALRLAREGADLFLVDVDAEMLAVTVSETESLGVRAVGYVCDLAERDEVRRIKDVVLQTFGRVDILVNNAGVCYYGSTIRMSQLQWDRLMAVNLEAPMQITRDLLPTLLSRPDAHVVNVASVCGFVAVRQYVAYTVSKFGLLGFTEALRAEFGRQGLGVTCVCPGLVSTDLLSSAELAREDKPVPIPPAWSCATAERVADKTIRGINRDKRLVLVTPLAYVLYYLNRFAPYVFDVMNRWGRRRRLLKKKHQAESVVNEKHAA